MNKTYWPEFIQGPINLYRVTDVLFFYGTDEDREKWWYRRLYGYY